MSGTLAVTGLATLGSLDVDDVLISGSNIGHTSDTDLMTVADGVVTVAGEVETTSLQIGGNSVPKQVFIEPNASHSAGTSGAATNSSYGNRAVITFADGEDEAAYFSGYFEYAPTAVEVIYIGSQAADQDMSYYVATIFCSTGDDNEDAHTDSIAQGTTTIQGKGGSGTVGALDIIAAFTGAAAGDFWGLKFNRDGADASDDINGRWDVIGIRVTY